MSARASKKRMQHLPAGDIGLKEIVLGISGAVLVAHEYGVAFLELQQT